MDFTKRIISLTREHCISLHTRYEQSRELQSSNLTSAHRWRQAANGTTSSVMRSIWTLLYSIYSYGSDHRPVDLSFVFYEIMDSLYNFQCYFLRPRIKLETQSSRAATPTAARLSKIKKPLAIRPRTKKKRSFRRKNPHRAMQRSRLLATYVGTSVKRICHRWNSSNIDRNI